MHLFRNKDAVGDDCYATVKAQSHTGHRADSVVITIYLITPSAQVTVLSACTSNILL